MRKIQSLLLLSLLLSLVAVSCHKHEDDENAPVIVITAPAVDASVIGIVAIAGVVTDEGLHELSIKVTKDSDNTELFIATPEVHDLTSYTIAEVWTPTSIVVETAVTLTVIASDHNDHTVTSTVKFKVKP